MTLKTTSCFNSDPSPPFGGQERIVQTLGSIRRPVYGLIKYNYFPHLSVVLWQNRCVSQPVSQMSRRI